MAIARTINPFTCFRDKKQLEDYVAAQEGTLLAISCAKGTRNLIRKYRKEKGFEEHIAYLENELEEQLRMVKNEYLDYRAWQDFTRMTINEARQFRNMIIEYIEEL
jgi:hypothetical protein